ncbi:hypothetical protein FEM03_17605 [Phragmitibacter flavus]|uniref:Uncharacterized protein n=1 Tax=Phragmitibacter flavus TaxID=2576071 RepID=A0A5R8KAW7_9BACT|nr:hypothetical protein [Phragmitibacter flavus]TLD69458.1 hypothetical protein FEM03_17605 [Phragmitibacter flavus]
MKPIQLISPSITRLIAFALFGTCLNMLTFNLNLSAQEPVRTALYKGKVQLRNADGSLVPFNQGRVGVTNAAGRMTDSTALARDGTYQFRLTNEPHIIQVLVRGYHFTPNPLRFHPRGPGDIPTIIATAQRADDPNNINNTRVPTPTGLDSGSNSNAPTVTGTILGNLKRHPRSQSQADVSNRHFLIKNASTGQLISTVRTNNQGQFRFSHPVGLRIIIEAKPGSGLTFTPPTVTTTIPRGTSNLDFVYTASNEVGTADRNLANDRTDVANFVKPTLKITQAPTSIILNNEIEFVATLDGKPMTPNYRYTFLVRYDTDRAWRTIANQQRSPKIRYTLPDSGHFAYKVVVYSAGVPLGSEEQRAFAREQTPPVTSNTQRGRPRAVGLGDFIPIYVEPAGNAPHIVLRVSIDQNQGQTGVQRWIKVAPYVKIEWPSASTTDMPRNNARVTYLVRHETQREWTIVHRNTPTLQWAWTPDRPGKWFLRVDFVPDRAHWNYNPGRAQIEFTANTRTANQNRDTEAQGNGITSRPSEGLCAE